MTQSSLKVSLSESIRGSLPSGDFMEVIGGPEDGKTFALSKDRMKLGRAGSNDMTIALDRKVSREHAQVIHEGGNPYIKDTNSSTGTFLDGKKISGTEPLRDGCEIVVGRTALVFRRGSGDTTSSETDQKGE